MRIAQQNDDEVCLVRALSLLCDMEQRAGAYGSALHKLHERVPASLHRLQQCDGLRDDEHTQLAARSALAAAKCLLHNNNNNNNGVPTSLCALNPHRHPIRGCRRVRAP